MPTYLDIHDLPGVKADAVAGAHEADVRVQDAYGVNYKHYWVDEEAGKVFCLVEAPSAEAATTVHREAEDLAVGLVDPVAQVSHVVRALRFQVGGVRSGDVVDVHATVDVMHVHVERH